MTYNALASHFADTSGAFPSHDLAQVGVPSATPPVTSVGALEMAEFARRFVIYEEKLGQ